MIPHSVLIKCWTVLLLLKALISSEGVCLWCLSICLGLFWVFRRSLTRYETPINILAWVCACFLACIPFIDTIWWTTKTWWTQRLLYASLQLCKLFIMVRDNGLTAVMESAMYCLSWQLNHTQTQYQNKQCCRKHLSPCGQETGTFISPVCTRITITIAYTWCI